jgi:uncharacterized membrane-anchored protein
MKSILTRAILLVAGLVVLVAVNGSIVAKERIKTHGERIFLELAPVDPRSLMQGDYMALRFAIAERISRESHASGAAPIVLDERGVATLDPTPRQDGLRIRFRLLHGEEVWLGTNAYFFEEGTASFYVHARYGEFRLDRDTGEAVLVGLRDADLRILTSAPAR